VPEALWYFHSMCLCLCCKTVSTRAWLFLEVKCAGQHFRLLLSFIQVKLWLQLAAYANCVGLPVLH